MGEQEVTVEIAFRSLMVLGCGQVTTSVTLEVIGFVP